MNIQSSCVVLLGVIIGLFVMLAAPARAVSAPLQSDARIFLVQPAQDLGLANNQAVAEDVVAVHCELGDCVSMRVPAHGAFDDRLGGLGDDVAGPRSTAQEQKSEEESLLDIGLMLVFAAGMFAYPLIRKQRALLHTSVLTTYV